MAADALPPARARAGGPGPSLIEQAVGQLSPAYFGMVMATGIVSIAAHWVGFTILANALFLLNIVAYVVLVVLNIVRLLACRHALVADLLDHQRGPGFFTAVAASCLLGSQFILLAGALRPAVALWTIAILLWVTLTYTIFTAFTVKEHKPSLDAGLSGAWLLAVVATQAIAVLAALIAESWEQPFRIEANFFALSMWLFGGMLYIWMISLIFYRYTFFPLAPGDLSPPYWINMGAMAISALAGSLLIINAPHAPFLLSLLPFLKGYTVLYWASGTWWIPMLAALFTWRHGYRRFPLHYDPLYWGAVFPLGMYAVATFRLIEALQLTFLSTVPGAFFAIALAAWALAFIGTVRSIWRHTIGLARMAREVRQPRNPR
ncbi:MAG: tellurite resistance/C4-dicarboxylate transporter family protein [Acidobacteria bacterium]|nr:tellurite resistance/C4-dicarboxylate transporter family protein [Acidobacteriota bacterium]